MNTEAFWWLAVLVAFLAFLVVPAAIIEGSVRWYRGLADRLATRRTMRLAAAREAQSRAFDQALDPYRSARVMRPAGEVKSLRKR